MDLRDRLAFTTIGCPGWSFEKVVSNAAAMGFSAIEIRGVADELQFWRVPSFLPQNRNATKELLRKNHLVISVIGTSSTFHEAGGTENAIAEGREAIALCEAMGIMGIRVFGDSFPPGEKKEDVLRRVADGLKTLCDAAKGGPVQVLLEIHGRFNTVDVLSDLMERMEGSSNFGFLWDLEHSYVACGNDFEPFYRLIGPYVRHVHVKDCRIVDGKAKTCLPGRGDVDIAGIVRMLERDGYRGLYSFEWEKRWIPELEEPESVFPLYVSFMNAL